MKSNTTFGVHFVLRSNKVVYGTAPIYARITVNTARIEISVKKRIQINNGNAGRGLAKAKTPDLNQLNSYLEQIRAQITTCYQDLVVNKQKVTPDAIKNKFLGIDDSGETIKGLIKYHNTHPDLLIKELEIKLTPFSFAFDATLPDQHNWGNQNYYCLCFKNRSI